MRDLNGTTLASINDIRTRFWAAAQAHGFEEWQTPVIERASLFSHSLGKESDVVSKEMFTFRTAGGDDVCLRPEGTAGEFDNT
jgi:histidyl-tRNA synthetase